ncbi:MAG: helix-turn-helix domain-containing protein [Clostridia bacterium]|nr:helix-turn-helix domain-containing protein [Clostridia bacterium]
MNHLLFPLNNYFSPNGYNAVKSHYEPEIYPTHFHDCMEITLLSEGTGWQNINGTEYYMPTYTLTVMSHQDIHRYYDLSENHLFCNLMFLPKLLSDETLKKIEDLHSDKICTVPESVGKSIAAITEALICSQDSNHEYPSNFASSLFEILVNIFLQHFVQSTASAEKLKGSILQESLIYINANFMTALSLNEIANHVKCSSAYLSELFHKKMGLTVKQYITNMRIKHAKKLLISSEQPIMSICFDCGFSSLASFNRNFFSIEKISPSAYRKMYIKSLPPRTKG